jgi:hypothetical protein
VPRHRHLDREGVRSLSSEDRPQLSISGRRRLVAGIAGLGVASAVLLAACGNAEHKISEDTRPDPRASTQGAEPAYPAPVGPRYLDGTASPANSIPPEDFVSQQGFGEKK